MSIAYVGIGNTPLIDLRDDTVTAAGLLAGLKAHDSGGNEIVGTLSNIWEMGEFTPTSDTNRPTINFSDAHDEAPIFVMMADMGDMSATSNSSFLIWVYADSFKVADNLSLPYGMVAYSYRVNNATITSESTTFTYPSSNAGASQNDYPRYYVTETGFKPSTGFTARYWRAGRTYKWIAIWKPSV